MFINSIDKIVTTYFAGVCSEPFNYRGKAYIPKQIRVSPLIFRGFTCPPKCGGCCPRFSLEYLPSEMRPSENDHQEYGVLINGRTIFMTHDAQDDHDSHFCRNLDQSTGRCGIHGLHPFHCDFELIRFRHSDDQVQIMQALFSRGWNFKRIDGERGSLCEMIPLDPAWQKDLIRRMKRLKQWAEHFRIETHMDSIIGWCETGPHDEPLIIPASDG